MSFPFWILKWPLPKATFAAREKPGQRTLLTVDGHQLEDRIVPAGAILFDQSTDTISVPGQTVVGTTSTYEARILFTPTYNGYGSAFNEWADGLEDKKFDVGPSSFDGLNVPVNAGSPIGAGVAMTANVWHHVAYVYDGSQERLYLDGVRVTVRPGSGDVADSSGSAFVGAIFRDAAIQGSVVGYMDTLRVSDVARYSGASFVAPLGDLRSDANTLLLYNFNEAPGSVTTTDGSSLGRTGSLGVGFAGATAPQFVADPLAAPAVASIVRSNPAGQFTSAASVTFQVTFDKVVNGVDAADFLAVGSAGVAFSSPLVVAGSGSAYTVTVNGITGNGSLRLDLVDDGSIRDVAGRALVTPGGLASFRPQQTFAFGANTVSVSLGDVNGDGKADLAVANAMSNSVSVRLGNGNGTFQNLQTFATGAGPFGMTLGDVNGDSQADFVVTNRTSNTVGVFLGNGSGLFPSQQTFNTAALPLALALGDVNGDNQPDVAVANRNSNSVSVLLGNGGGTFLGQQTFATGAFPRSVALGDVNGDGKADLVLANQNGESVSVLLGNGNGTFQGQQTFAAGAFPFSVTLGDFNADGKADLVVANATIFAVSVLLGNGDGTFSAPRTYFTQLGSTAVALGDMNGDGKPDLNVANFNSVNSSVLLGNGDGSFQPEQTFSNGNGPQSIALADVNGDGRADLAIANYNDGTVSVLLGNANGNFTGQAYTIDRDAPSAGIVAVAPDPRPTSVGAVAINFNEPVQNLDSADFTLTRDGNPVPLNPSMLTGGGGQYSLDLSAATASAGNPVPGSYILTLNASDVQDLAGNPLASGASDAWQIRVATATALTATPNATTGGMLVTFTATVSPSPNIAGSVTFRDNGFDVPGGVNIAVNGGVAVFSTDTLSIGSHPITAVYNGSANYLASPASNVAIVDVSNPAPPPQVVGIAVNGNLPAFAGAQRSRVVRLQVVFDQAVQVDAGAFALALHTNNLGLGALPTNLNFATIDGGATWALTFAGNTDPGSTDGFESIKDGVYDLIVNAALVHPLGVPTVSGSGTTTSTFYRLFGDASGEELPQTGNAHVAIIAIDDNFAFRNSFNSAANYKSYLDFEGDTNIGISDNFQFRSRFNRPLTWNA